jgi:hypothetical protein
MYLGTYRSVTRLGELGENRRIRSQHFWSTSYRNIYGLILTKKDWAIFLQKHLVTLPIYVRRPKLLSSDSDQKRDNSLNGKKLFKVAQPLFSLRPTMGPSG